jgi:sialate O-acetylesterase
MTQDEDNFEQWSVDPAPYIREAQRLGIAGLPKTGFIPAYDEKIPGLHTLKKKALAVRAVRWALKEVYGMDIIWDTVNLISAEPVGDRMLLTFDKPVEPDDTGPIVGFSIADKSGKFYIARAQSLITAPQGIWGNKYDRTKVYVWSPLVKEPVAVRYAWARSPMGSLKVNGKPWQPVPSFRTDSWDWPEPKLGESMPRSVSGEMMKEAGERVAYRRQQEVEMAVEILKHPSIGLADPQHAPTGPAQPKRAKKAATKGAANRAKGTK